MKLVPQKLGAENKKKIMWLGGLVAVLIGVLIWNSASSDSSPGPAGPPPKAAATPGALGPRAAPVTSSQVVPGQRPMRGQPGRADDFHPTLKLADNIDVSKIDPTLKLELLAKLKKIEMEGGARSLFDFGQPPPPPAPKIDPLHPGPMTTSLNGKGPDKPVEPPKPPGPPPPPPIPLKFYGYSSTVKSGARRAFFLNGDDIFVAGENDTIQNRYKVIRIGVNSAVVEDTTNHHQQTIPLVEELAG